MIIQPPTFEILRPGTLGYREGLFRLASPMRYNWVSKNTVFSIPEGFVTDFASIPKALRIFVSVNGNTSLPAVLHDYLYSGEHGLLPNGIQYTRKQADYEFMNCMLQESVTPCKAKLFYKAVRKFGHFHTGLR